jgi:hypothetical protein
LNKKLLMIQRRPSQQQKYANKWVLNERKI